MKSQDMHSFRTFAQRNVLPLLGIIPLLLSIATFVYDYYSDVDLTIQGGRTGQIFNQLIDGFLFNKMQLVYIQQDFLTGITGTQSNFLQSWKCSQKLEI